MIQPRSAYEVVEALVFARDQEVPLAVRSGGHGISGRSTNDGGVVIDLSRMRQITVLSDQNHLVRVAPGARWKDVAAALAPHGWALSSGDYGGVGVGGLATAGGIGWLAREHGLTIDHLRAAEMVLAGGSRVRVSERENPGVAYFFQVRSVGGAVADVPEDATAYLHRAANFSVVAFGASKPRLDAAWERLATHFRGLYL